MSAMTLRFAKQIESENVGSVLTALRLEALLSRRLAGSLPSDRTVGGPPLRDPEPPAASPGWQTPESAVSADVGLPANTTRGSVAGAALG
jgi:hypothetical protein